MAMRIQVEIKRAVVAMLVAAAVLAGEATTKVTFFFDTEDFIQPRSADAIRDGIRCVMASQDTLAMQVRPRTGLTMIWFMECRPADSGRGRTASSARDNGCTVWQPARTREMSIRCRKKA